ncbi:MAG: 2Fe-2S iron-sulfur cluster binding domain-containing protein [Nevskiaceae bacterium]|nr:MAG: 2Fe-2S iron-sulfur cluster binding domain-containing protein [Nevskiaceae bacterium]TBR74571.1 MAG: 2Fe-2S iron-sulfur cluster binding domain-containing protein [Nevskiaceae bacterium]
MKILTVAELQGQKERAGAAALSSRVTVVGSGTTFQVPKGDLLLMSALAQGVDYPHNCRVGTCGTCKTRLLKGRISPLVDFALSPLTNEELENGYILACQSKVRTDLEIDVKLGTGHRDLPVRSVAGHVCAWRRLPGEVVDLRLRLDAPLMFAAGQYGILAPSGSFVQRSYSFYDAPPDPAGSGAQEVGFLVRRLPGGKFSAWVYGADLKGAKLWLQAPMGTMGFDEFDRDGLCVAGGTGLAPILSIVSHRLKQSATARFTIVFGSRSAQDNFADALLANLLERESQRVRLVNILSNEPTGSAWRGRRGLVTDALDAALGVDYANAAAFVCGSLPMVEAVEKKLLQLGVDPDRVHADKFVPAAY